MNERPIDEDSLQRRALEGVRNLKEVARNRERSYPHDIQAVLVLTSKEEWSRGIDRERILEGVGVVREVTAARENFHWGGQRNGHDVNQDQIALDGPYFVYSGIPEENEALKKALKSKPNELPEGKIIILDKVIDADGTTRPIGHRGDLFKSFFQEITDPNSPLSGVRNVALIGHYSDFDIHPFNPQKFNRALEENGFEGLYFWAYAIKDRLGTGKELEKLKFKREMVYANHRGLAIPTGTLTFRVSQTDAELPS